MVKKIHDQVSSLVEQSRSTEDTCLLNEDLISQIRTAAQNFVNELLSEPNKRKISEKDVRMRLNGYLKHELDEDALNPDPLPELSVIYPDGSSEKRPLDIIFEKESAELTNNVNTLDHSEDWFDPSIIEMVSKEIFDRDEITNENAISLVKSFLRTKAIYSKIKAARIRGDYRFEQAFYSSESTEYPRNKSANIESQPKDSINIQNILLSDFIEKYSAIQISDKAWKEHSLADHVSRLKNIIDILGDRCVNDVSREDMRYVRDTLLKLPPSRKKSPKYRAKSISELLLMTHDRTLTVKTVNIIIEAISSMYEWGIREGLVSANPAKGLSIKDEQPDIEKRYPLSDADIQEVFFDENYKPSSFSDPAYYWVPLIGLYSGMRLEEICQLHCEDVYQDTDGTWIFDIRTESKDGLNDKNLKNKNAIRKVPVHNELKNLGLLLYLKQEQEKGEIRLFSHLNKTEKSPKYGKQVGKVFSNLLRKKGITGNKSFHSLRHSFSNFFKARGLQDDVFRQIMGHEIPQLAGRQYGERFSSSLCYEKIIGILNYKNSNKN